MSRSTIGGVAGAIIGFVASGYNPQGAYWGWVIGSGVGALTDNTKTYGPRLQDASQQTSQDGTPRTYGYGTFPTSGVILWRDKRKEIEDEQGKGGPSQVTYRYTWSYAIGVCVGPINGYLIVRRNGTIVYDTRPNEELTAIGYSADEIAKTRMAQANWMKNAKLYLGDEDQLPDPTIQAVKGLNNTPAYRGYAYIVLNNEDVTNDGGAIPQYDFVVSECGTTSYNEGGDTSLEPVRWVQSTATGGPADVTGDFTSFQSGSNTAGYVTSDAFVSDGDWYWETTTGWVLKAGSLINHFGSAGIVRTGDSEFGLVLKRVGAGVEGWAEFSNGTLGANQILDPTWVPLATDTPSYARIRNRLSFGSGSATWSVAIENGPWVPVMSGEGGEFSPYAMSRGTYLDPGASDTKTVWIYSTPDKFNYPVPDGAQPLAAWNRDQREIPDSPGYYVDQDGNVTGPSGVQTQRCRPRLSHLVSSQTLKREISRIVTTELYDTLVDGFRVATQTSPLANIQSLMSAYQFDGSEHDGQLWFLMRRQRELTFTITLDDLVEQSGDPFEWEITKENDLLRKVTVNYFDPMTNYTKTSQDWEMRSSTIKALGEGTFEMALTGTANWAKQGAEMSGRIAWAERRETKLKVPLWHAARYTGEWGQLIDKFGAAHIVRITQINDEGATRELTLRKTRHNAYESLAEGVASPLPTFPTGNVRGPTVSVVMNMPAMRVDDDKAGVYWAATGLLSTWRGASLGLSRTPGSWLAGPSMQNSCTMGWLTSTLPSASKFGRDETNVLTVHLFPYCPKTLESTDEDGMYAEANAAALVYPSGKVEIIQFKTATLVAPNTYELTSLWRGRKDTTPGEHLEDAMFVLLDNAVRFVAINPSDVGQTLTFRAVSTGTDPDAADEDTLTFTTMESLREWQPYNVVVTPDGLGGYCVKWIGRGRLGSDRFPIDSQYFDGYEVRFTIGSVVHSVSTASQSVCVAAADLIGTFGTSMGLPDITVRAKSKIATNDDDFDSPPGVPTDPNPSYPATIIGEPGDMYEGEGVLDYLGPTNNPPFQAYGGKTEQYFTGYIARNVTCQGFSPGSGFMVGIPLTAETEDADTTMVASGPDIVGGPFTITDSVTVLPMPSFALMDELSPWGSKALVTLVTSTPRTTKRIGSSGLGGLRSRAGFSTGKRRCEFIIDDMPAGGRIAIGVLAGGVDAHLAPGTGSSFAHIVTANGTFAVEVDAPTGAVEVFELGVGLVASGTLPLAYAHDGKYRFGWVANNALHPAVGASVYTNQGNEAWLITPTGAFGGVPNESHVIPCGFDAEVGVANGYLPQGTQSLTLAGVGGFSGTSVIYAYSEFAKSTGAWRIGMSAGTSARIGLCKAGHTGLLGQGGDSFGMYYDFAVIGSPMIVFDTTWAGQIRIPHPFYTMDRKIIFVCDFDAHTVEVWGKPQFSDYILLAVLTGLPGGSWVPAGNHAVEIINGASEISGATDWSVTKTP